MAYEKIAPFYRHATCQLLWRMVPYVEWNGEKIETRFYMPEVLALDDWPRDLYEWRLANIRNV